MKVLVGTKYLPMEIQNYMRNKVSFRPHIPHQYHVSTLVGCLKQYFYGIVNPYRCSFSLEDCFNLSRGILFDKVFTPLFSLHQKTYTLTMDGATITGTLDFVAFDGELGERVLYDLKAPKSTFYLKNGDARPHYERQVLCYLALAKQNRDLEDVHRCRVLFITGDVVI